MGKYINSEFKIFNLNKIKIRKDTNKRLDVRLEVDVRIKKNKKINYVYRLVYE